MSRLIRLPFSFSDKRRGISIPLEDSQETFEGVITSE